MRRLREVGVWAAPVAAVMASCAVSIALAQQGNADPAAWKSLGLARSATDLGLDARDCELKEVVESLEPSALWALERPLSLERLEAVPDALDRSTAVLASPALADAVRDRVGDEGVLVFPYGAVVRLGTVRSHLGGECPKGTVSGLEVGRFALLRFELRFERPRVGEYVRTVFGTGRAAPEDLFDIAETIAAVNPGTLDLEARLLTDLGSELPALNALGGLLADCNLGRIDGCRALARSFSDTLRSEPSVPTVLSRALSARTLDPEASVVSRRIEGSAGSVTRRRDSADAFRALRRSAAALIADPFTEAVESDAARDSLESIGARMRAVPWNEGLEETLARDVARTREWVGEARQRNSAQSVCEGMELQDWTLVERIVAPVPVQDCREAARTAMILEKWVPETTDGLDDRALPFLARRKYVRLTGAIARDGRLQRLLLGLRDLEELRIPEGARSFVTNLLQKSGVEVIEE